MITLLDFVDCINNSLPSLSQVIYKFDSLNMPISKEQAEAYANGQKLKVRSGVVGSTRLTDQDIVERLILQTNISEVGIGIIAFNTELFHDDRFGLDEFAGYNDFYHLSVGSEPEGIFLLEAEGNSVKKVTDKPVQLFYFLKAYNEYHRMKIFRTAFDFQREFAFFKELCGNGFLREFITDLIYEFPKRK